MFFTGAGDNGKSTVGNKKNQKDELFFDFLGDIDELNSWIGFCKTEAERIEKKNKKFGFICISLSKMQEMLFVLQAEIASVKFGFSLPFQKISEKDIDFLENSILKIDSKLPRIKNFVISGGSELSSRLDISRAIARRTERVAVSFLKNKKNSKDVLSFLNRFSSALFAMARYSNFLLHKKEKNPSYK